MDQAVTISWCYSWREEASVLRIFRKHEKESDRTIAILQQKTMSDIFFEMIFLSTFSTQFSTVLGEKLLSSNVDSGSLSFLPSSVSAAE